MKNIRMTSDWPRVALLLSKMSHSMACLVLYGKQRSQRHKRLFTIAMSLKHKRSVVSIEDIKGRCRRYHIPNDLQVLFHNERHSLNIIGFARFCSSLIFIFSTIRTLDHLDYFMWSQRAQIIEVRL